MGATGLLIGSALFQGFNSITTANQQASALRMQAEFQKSQANVNSQIAEVQAKDSLARGEKAATDVRAKSREVISAQRANFAAQGIDVESGTALTLQEESAVNGAKDALTVRNNAWREAWGFKSQALLSTSQGRFTEMGLRNQASQTLLSGGMDALGYGLKAGAYAYGSGGSGSGRVRARDDQFKEGYV